MMDRVTDVFAFACADARWWDLLDQDAELPAAVRAEVDAEAFGAARDHVLDAMVELLRASFERFRDAAPPDDQRFAALRAKKFSQGQVRGKWFVWARLGASTEHSLNLSIEPDHAQERLRLYGFVEGPDAFLERLMAEIPPNPPLVQREGEGYYFGHLELREGASFRELADQLLEAGWPMVRAAVDIVEPAPVGRQPSSVV